MFRKALERDLKAIFQVKKVIFQRLETAVEQDVLYCDIESVRELVRRGQEAARISGRIGILGAAEGNPYGFFMKMAEKAPAAIEKRFWFGKKESPAEFTPGWELKMRSVPFVYFYTEEYYPVKGKITAIECFFNLIKRSKNK